MMGPASGDGRRTEGAAMTDEPYMDARQNFAARAMDMSRNVLKEAMAWDLFKWVVVALLIANLLLLALVSGSIKSHIAALKQDSGTSAQDAADFGKQIADAKAGLAQAISEMRSALHDDVARISAKLDVRVQQPPKPAAPAAAAAPKPAAKPPKPQ
ncbi:MAG TPA: hypothetical protein DIC31_02975 [Rhizobiales bacterium]|nr:hypothetical protein [Hyphomicrobiales bacterium]